LGVSRSARNVLTVVDNFRSNTTIGMSEVTGLAMGLESTGLVEAVFREEEAGILVLGGQFNILFSLLHMRTHRSQTTKLLEVVSVQPLLSGADKTPPAYWGCSSSSCPPPTVQRQDGVSTYLCA
jgi:hypothetical protein